MVNEKTFAVVGGDLRNAHIANTLAGKSSDYRVYGMFLDRDVKLSHRVHKTNNIKLVLPQSDFIIFPVPMCSLAGKINTPLCGEELSVEECFDYIQPEALALAGQVTDDVYDIAVRRDVQIADYLKREEFAIMNAVPRALAKRV